MKKRPFEEIRNEIADISQVNMEEMIREYGEGEAVRLMNVIMENNVTMLKLQKQILELHVAAKKKRRKELEEEEEKKRIDKEWRRVKEIRV